MNMHVNRRGSVDVEFQRSRGEDEETSREFATRFSDIRGGEDEEDTIKRVQSALLARRVVAKEQDDTVFPPSSNGGATIRRGYNTVEVLTGRMLGGGVSNIDLCYCASKPVCLSSYVSIFFYYFLTNIYYCVDVALLILAASSLSWLSFSHLLEFLEFLEFFFAASDIDFSVFPIFRFLVFSRNSIVSTLLYIQERRMVKVSNKKKKRRSRHQTKKYRLKKSQNTKRRNLK